MVGPMATSVEIQGAAEGCYMLCIEEAVVAAARGVSAMQPKKS
jgi:hypothetical protein